MPLPAELQPPLEVALPRPAGAIPAGSALPGGAVYEPKWDGFRLLVVVDDEEVSLWSRQGKNLTRYFPDIAAAAAEQLPRGVVVDGEAVVWQDGRLSFDALQHRLTSSASTALRTSRQTPASYAAFDLLALADQDVRGLTLQDRRALLTELAREWRAPLHLSPATTYLEEAERWFVDLASAGMEGVVAKGAADPYRGGQRQWVKIKRRDTLDVICGAVIGARSRPRELVIGLPVDGELRIVGRSTPLRPATSTSLGRLLRSPGAAHPWPETVSPGALDRFNSRGPVAVQLTLVAPLVVEISTDIAKTGVSFRHAVRFLRARPDLPAHW
ncbi:ATP-dependent DNA ligase [Microbacterium thalli]|uniref:ATP-dependent DNA ligase n=1 Tax=Microbacterium thalli TaxID=3027921 RepID=UPI00308260A4